MSIIVRLTLLSSLLVMGTACSMPFLVKDEFDRSSTEYARLLRWQELEKAADTYVDASLLAEYRKRIVAAKDVRVVDYRIKSVECDPKAKKAEVTMELDYYSIPSTRVKTLSDTQKWLYKEEAGRTGWRLESLLPEFR